MRIKRLNEEVEEKVSWYFEIRYYFDYFDYSEEYYVINLDDDFDDYDWEEEAGSRDIMQDEELFTNLTVHLMMKNPGNTYKLVKVSEEIISNDKIKMLLQSKKYNM